VANTKKTDAPEALILEHIPVEVIELLDTTTMPQFARLPALIVVALQDAVDEEMRVAKNHAAMLAVALNYRYAEKDREYRSKTLKPTGLVRFADQEAIVVANQAKQVHWDREKLIAAFDKMEPGLADKYAKHTLSVEERLFTEAPAKIRALLEPARTVSTGKASYRLELPEAAKGEAA
jgi:hypothetical protein